jgi:chemotaxis protein histidine kinase CheA
MSNKDTDQGGDDDFSIIQVPNTLAAKTKKVEGTLNDLLASAEEKLAGMKQDFETLIDAVVSQLPVTQSQLWNDPARRPAAIESFARAANTLKGKSGSFGFGVLGEIADLFRDYVRETPAADQQASAITNYISTLQLMWKQRITGDGGPVGRQIVADLVKLNEQAKKS